LKPYFSGVSKESFVFILAQSALSRKQGSIPDCGFRILSVFLFHPHSALRHVECRAHGEAFWGSFLDTRPSLWNIETNDLMNDGRVPEGLAATFCT
jgi:hypothetical protein